LPFDSHKGPLIPSITYIDFQTFPNVFPFPMQYNISIHLSIHMSMCSYIYT
jgi:hypothetical protein